MHDRWDAAVMHGLRATSLLAAFLSCTPAVGVAQSGPAMERLDVSIVQFDPGVPDDRTLHDDMEVFPRIRKIEALLFPFILRESLVETGEWGAVRVEPAADLASEVLVTGEILYSDGEALVIGVRAVDAAGRVWIDRSFSGDQTLYREIATALREARNGLDERQLKAIPAISMLRYAQALAPTAFSDYLATADDGTLVLQRLPARGDPMLERIHRIRETVYVFTDTVDAKYRDLHADIASVYEVWREYRDKTRKYEVQNAEHASATQFAAPRGSYEDLLNQYENYKWDRLTAQEQDRLAVAFDNEVRPTIAAMESRIADLEGWVEEKYVEWHGLLEALFDAESEVEPVDESLIEQIRQLP